LGAVSLLPFPTRAFVDHIQGDANTRTAAILYAAALAVPMLLWTVKWFYAVSNQLLDPRIADRYLLRGKKLYLATTCGLTVATAITFVEWRLGLVLAGLITLSYLLPPKSPEYKPG
jgi:uncharacterized membrane protein